MGGASEGEGGIECPIQLQRSTAASLTDPVAPCRLPACLAADKIEQALTRNVAKLFAAYQQALKPRLLVLPGLLAAAAAWNAALPDLQLGAVEQGCLLGGFLSYKVGSACSCCCGSGGCGDGAALLVCCGEAWVAPAACRSPLPAQRCHADARFPSFPFSSLLSSFPPVHSSWRQVALVLKIYADLKPQPLTEEQLLRQQRPLLAPVEDVKLDLREIGRRKAAEAAGGAAAAAVGGAAAAGQQPEQRQEQQQ